MNIRVLLMFYLLAIVLLSCQKVISVDVGSSAAQLVIEGNLTDHQGTQTVTLSKSVPYGNANVYPAVTGATVTLNDNTNTTYRFTETQPGTYTINNFKGRALIFYVLTVKAEGKTYYGGSTMQFPTNLDSLTLISQTFGSKSVINVVVNYQDPANIANQYRFVMYVNSVQVKQIFVENDQLSDGRSVSTTLYQHDIDLKKGDKVDVDMECIDGNMYNYWNSLSSQGGNTPQNSATPSNPPSNILGGALGYFSAHTVQRKSIVIP
ncbi:hypothetical protein BEL04_03215 [Mucilaginibacter sp. PPCGB 2223]|uniref:DUF4249 domain-containing protein n=1 Tax=Mucilaginibacter sp. PPCGB 2223 TaxID=1886027 RepID=UPI000824BD58|nr:DUF4249 domain-containing protein [Mucilaginibacter sp. PPCGB 2223]OCX53326.1 hypothetical protein BEL04_03215 [Mucilaginibacter sp. PPCGB 2223]